MVRRYDNRTGSCRWFLNVALLLATLGTGWAEAREPALDPADMVEVELASIAVDPLVGAPLVLLRELESGDIVPIVIGLAEARAILLAMHGAELPRPLTHDLIVNLLEAFGATLQRLLIDDLVDNTYLGLLELVLPDRDEPILVDSRPSDGLALAVRSGATIHVAPKVLDASRERHFEGLESDQVATALSITVVAIDDDIRASLQLPERPGVIVNQARGPALDAGISAGMMILKINGEPVASPMEFLTRVSETPMDGAVQITLWHDGAESVVSLPMQPTAPGRSDSREPAIRA